MKMNPKWRRYDRLMGPDTAGDVRAELRFHLEAKVDELMAQGWSAEEARREAERVFGDLRAVQGVGERIGERMERRRRWREYWSDAVRDVRYAVRILAKSPGFTAVIVLTLALGIGANTAIFTLVNAVLLQSIPVLDPQQLAVPQWSARNEPRKVGFHTFGDCSDNREDTEGCAFSYSMFQEFQRQRNLFTDTAAFIGPYQMDLSGNGAAAIAQGELVSGSYFQTLGVSAVLGRTLMPEDEKPGALSVAVLDYGYWQRAFGGSPAAIGRTIHLNHAAFTIVGVTEPEFTRLTPGKAVDLWVSVNQTSALGLKQSLTDATDWWLVVVGRLRPGVSRAQAQGALNALYLNEIFHGAKVGWDFTDNPRLTLEPAQVALTGIRSMYGKPLLLLMAAVGLILLIACANVAGLMLARATVREREMAVRLAMGAAKRRVVRQLLTESLLVSCIGAALGAILAPVGVSSLAAFFAKNTYSALYLDLHVDARVLLFTIAAALLTGIGFGLAPAFRGARTGVTEQLKGNTTTAATTHGRGRMVGLGSALVVLQVTLSMIVLSGAALLLRTLDNLHKIEPGFDTHNLILFGINPKLAGDTDAQIHELYTTLQSKLAALPGVTSVSYSSEALLDGGYSGRNVRVEGLASKGLVPVQTLSVGPDYFQTMKIPLLEGRLLGEADTDATGHVLVNRIFVQEYASGRNPLGLHFSGRRPDDPQWEIVGVVGDTKFGFLRRDDQPMAYMPLASEGATFAVRTGIAPAALMPTVRNAVNSVDPNLPIVRLRTQTDSIDRLLFNERLMARLLSLFAAVGLALACIGLYGLLAYEVGRRTREIGIRTALGAQRRHIASIVVRRGIVLVVAGALGGCIAALAVTRLLTSLLYDVKPADPLTFALTAGLLLLVGIMACLLPARRAATVDPMQALRSE